jgi:sulfite exporter TauE/SafE
MALGALAGLLGKSFSFTPWLQSLSAVLMAGFFLLVAFLLWTKGKEVTLLPQFIATRLQNTFLNRFPTATSTRWGAFSLGLFSALLPCGWLHTFVISAIATGSAAKGAALLMAFWAGTVPALALGVGLLKKIIQPITVRHPRFVALLLIVAAVGTVSLRARNITQVHSEAPAKHCH